MKYKQVIVIRHDLHMRMGKAVAQGAHAAMMFLVAKAARGLKPPDIFRSEDIAWMYESHMTKICLRVESEEELLAIEQKAHEANLPVHLIIDAGFTKFAGVPTKTCLAIGPDLAEKIDAITGHLKLL